MRDVMCVFAFIEHQHDNTQHTHNAHMMIFMLSMDTCDVRALVLVYIWVHI